MGNISTESGLVNDTSIPGLPMLDNSIHTRRDRFDVPLYGFLNTERSTFSNNDLES